MSILILNPSAFFLRLRARNGRFSEKMPMLHFAPERAGEWYIPFVNTKMRVNISCVAYAGVGEEVNRVRENERGWDALNENFNSPVHEIVGERGLYAFLTRKTPLYSTVRISGPPEVT